MKKFGLIIAALALVLGLSQCRQPDISKWQTGNKQTVEFTTNYNGGAKGELMDATTLLNYKWDKDDLDGNGKTDKLYVYAQDGGTTFTSGTFIGILPIVEVSEGGYAAKFAAELENVPNSGVLRFVHYGQDVAVDEETGAVSSVDFSTQKGTLPEISKHVVAVCDKAYTGGTIFDKCDMEIQFAIAKFKFEGFGTDKDITVSGMSATGLEVASTGVISKNSILSTTLEKPGTSEFYTVFMPKGSSTYVFSSAVAVADFDNWEFKENKYYTKDNGTGNPTGDPIVVEKEKDPVSAPTSVTTVEGCSNFIYSCGGTVTLTVAQTCEVGVVYSKTETVPEVGKTNCEKIGESVSLPVGTSSFTVDITGLEKDATYYVRAYAIGQESTVVHAPATEAGIKTVLGNNVPQPVNWNGDTEHPIKGASPKEFTVSKTKVGDVTTYNKVHFSQGNLQYKGSTATKYWKFAEHQFDIIMKSKDATTDIDPNIDRDLFCWGTSGQDHGAVNYNPWEVGGSYKNYYAYGDVNKNLEDETGKADWGYNAIENSDNTENSGWRTLTSDEWNYLINSRPNHGDLYGYGKVNCTTGLIILPDDWVNPGLPFTKGGASSAAWVNNYGYSDWSLMEASGAVFLPAAGRRAVVSGGYITVTYIGQLGLYWSSTHTGTYAKRTHFRECSVSNGEQYNRNEGFSVRLVRDAE